MIDKYYDWLCERLRLKPISSGYEWLCAKLMTIPFKAVKTVTDDNNRVSDALYLRSTFCYKFSLDARARRDFYRSLGPCSVFEIMVVMIEEMCFLMGSNALASNDPSSLFFELIDNLDLGYLNDWCYRHDPKSCDEEAEETVAVFVNREYEYDGYGGLFPLEHADEDQRTVNLYHQMELYLIERYDILD